jgi:hypothetical protein
MLMINAALVYIVVPFKCVIVFLSRNNITFPHDLAWLLTRDQIDDSISYYEAHTTFTIHQK